MAIFSSFYKQESAGIGTMVDATNGRKSMQSGLAYRDTIRSRRYRAFRYQVQSEGFLAALKSLRAKKN